MPDISEAVHNKAQEILATPSEGFVDVLNGALNELLGDVFTCVPGLVRSADGSQSETFAAVICKAAAEAGDSPYSPADDTAAVIDVFDELSIDKLRSSFERIAAVKRLRKTAVPNEEQPRTNITLGIILARTSSVPMDRIAEEFDRLNADTPSYQWPDMVVVMSSGAINRGVQFPGSAKISGDFLPPAAGAGQKFVPAVYIITVLKPTGTRAFNSMVKLLVAHLFIFSPGAKVPTPDDVSKGVGKAVTFTGYQFNLSGDLLPMPRQFYNDRLLPEVPLHIESQEGEILATVQFIPWQNGGVVILRGKKLPLVGLMPFFGRPDILQRNQVIPDEDRQVSSVLPITRADFVNWLQTFQRQSNMVIRKDPGRFVVQKIADEGASSPFMARLFITPLRLREMAIEDAAARDRFDKLHDAITSDLVNARSAAEKIGQTWAGHVAKLASGEIIRHQGDTIQVGESIDREMRQEVETFINSSVRVLKTGMQALAGECGVDIGALFQKQGAFEPGIAALRSTRPELADYLEKTRTWSEPLMISRIAVEHESWKLPRVKHVPDANKLVAEEPMVGGQPVTRFVGNCFDRLSRFTEEFTVYCLAQKFPKDFAITEIPLAERSAEVPERFTITISSGGMPPWRLAYDGKPFLQS